MTSSASRTPAPSVRERLLDAADRLFYQEGVRAVGIDRVLAEAEAAKASLYTHFSCKDDLIAAYVGRRIDNARDGIEAYVAGIPPAERAVRFFEYVEAWTSQPDFRGCPVQHVVGELADAQHPARVLAAEQRTWLRARFVQWAHEAGVSNAEFVGGVLLTLFDGAVAAAEHDGPVRARDAKWAAERLIAYAREQSK